MFGHVRLITFDLDDTLWPCHEVIRQAEVACHAWLHEHAPRLTRRYSAAELRAHRIGLGARCPAIAHDLTEVRRRSMAELLEACGYEAGLADAASDVFRAARNCVTPFDEVLDALQRLRQRYVLVSVTNGNSQIEHTPLHASFDLSLTAAEVGAAKPDPAMFHAASSHSGIPLDATLHVGDDPLRDVAAARAIGVATAWVNRGGAAWPVPLRAADVEIRDLNELVARLIG